MTRGLGELQKKQILETHYRILRPLHKLYRSRKGLRTKYYSFEVLRKHTGIHRNTLQLRLNELAEHGVIFKVKYRRPHNRLTGHYVYHVDVYQRLRTSKALIKSVYYPPPVDEGFYSTY